MYGKWFCSSYDPSYNHPQSLGKVGGSLLYYDHFLAYLFSSFRYMQGKSLLSSYYLRDRSSHDEAQSQSKW